MGMKVWRVRVGTVGWKCASDMGDVAGQWPLAKSIMGTQKQLLLF